MKLRCPFKVNLFSRENTEFVFILFRHLKKMSMKIFLFILKFLSQNYFVHL